MSERARPSSGKKQPHLPTVSRLLAPVGVFSHSFAITNTLTPNTCNTRTFTESILDCDSSSEWIDSKLAGKQDGTAAGILEECILDDDGGKCERFTAALEKLDEMLGVGASEQY